MKNTTSLSLTCAITKVLVFECDMFSGNVGLKFRVNWLSSTKIIRNVQATGIYFDLQLEMLLVT